MSHIKLSYYKWLNYAENESIYIQNQIQNREVLMKYTYLIEIWVVGVILCTNV